MGKIIKTVKCVALGALLMMGLATGARADVYWLPKYQETFAKWRVNDANNPSMATPGSCEEKGWLSAPPAGNICTKRYIVGAANKTCYTDCKCDNKYKYISGKNVSGGCPNGKTVTGPSCGGKYAECMDCTTNSSVASGWTTNVRSGSNIAVMSNFGTCANYYYACASGHQPAAATGGGYLQSGPWSWISCGDGKMPTNQDGSTSTPRLCQRCEAKTCQDYNSGYEEGNDATKNCTKIDTASVGGLNCWSCVDCDTSLYKYDRVSCPSPKILGTDLCAGKASTCACPAAISCASGLTCKTNAPSGCSGCLECNACPNAGTITGACPSGYICALEVCSGKYYISGCAINSVNLGTCSWYSCWVKPDSLAGCTPVADESGCASGTEDCSNGCGGTRKCCKACPPTPSEEGCGYGTISCSDGCGGTRQCCAACTPIANDTDCTYGTEACDNNCGGTRQCCKACTPLADEPNCSYTYSCSDGCGGTRKCCDDSLLPVLPDKPCIETPGGHQCFKPGEKI